MIDYKTVFQLAQAKGYKGKFIVINVLHEMSVYKEGFGEPELTDEELLLSLTLIQQWLREEHKIDVDTKRAGAIHSPTTGYTVCVYSIEKVLFHWDTGGVHNSYESALLEGINEALKLI